jgi:hypothetical protein
LDYGSIIQTTITTIGAIGVAYISIQQRRDREHNAKCESLRAEGALLQLEMIQAVLKLSKVTAKAVRNQTLNGDVEDAERWVHTVEIKFADYMRRITQEV